jgi:hypothetical protein
MFRRGGRHETLRRHDETILSFVAEVPKQPLVISLSTTRRTAPPTWRRQMRMLSLILAFAFVLAGPSVAGFADGGLPGIGTFSYNGSMAANAPTTLLASVR